MKIHKRIRSLIILSIICLYALVGCFSLERELSPALVKEQALHFFKSIKDTTDIGVTKVSQDKHNHWFIAYNKTHTTPHLFLFHSEEPNEAAHDISLKHKNIAAVENVYFEDVTYNGEYELIVELHYDYDIAYQGREFIIYQHPFDTAGQTHEIFNFMFEQVWETIDSFDKTYGTPLHTQRVENHASYTFFEGFILIKGIVNSHRNHLVEYKWDKALQQFRLELDEDLHEAEEEENVGGIVHKVKGTKVLLEVNAHEEGCRSFLIEDVGHHVIKIKENIHDALLCSPITSLSKDGRYLVYTNKNTHSLNLYDFDTDEDHQLVQDVDTYEGISDIIWTAKKMRFAFVLVNPEELLENTQVQVYDIDKEGKLDRHTYNLEIFYECDLEGTCIPQKDYDFRFSSSGNFIYKYNNTGNTLEDFAVLKLP
ncbi:MAG: hypothetical protein GY810_22395 [Aureispira sp.]|nr:hypothetical protein [Aureispira sp.]